MHGVAKHSHRYRLPAPTEATAGTSYYRFSPYYYLESVDSLIFHQIRFYFVVSVSVVTYFTAFSIDRCCYQELRYVIMPVILNREIHEAEFKRCLKMRCVQFV